MPRGVVVWVGGDQRQGASGSGGMGVGLAGLLGAPAAGGEPAQPRAEIVCLLAFDLLKPFLDAIGVSQRVNAEMDREQVEVDPRPNRAALVDRLARLQDGGHRQVQGTAEVAAVVDKLTDNPALEA